MDKAQLADPVGEPFRIPNETRVLNISLGFQARKVRVMLSCGHETGGLADT